MEMIFIKALFDGLLLFVGLLILQLFIWRVLKPKKQMLLLLVLFFVLPFVLTAYSFYIESGLVFIFLVTLAIGTAYVMSFPAAAAQSPTLVLVNSVIKNNLKTEGEIYQSLGGRLVKDRLDDLQSDGLVYIENDQIKLKKAGQLLAICFIKFRQFLGLPEGQG